LHVLVALCIGQHVDGWDADERLLVAEVDDRRRLGSALIVEHDLGPSVADHGHAGVGRAEVDPEQGARHLHGRR
jgi:hypothetical protein